MLHQACCARALPAPHWLDILRVCLKLGANVNDVDSVGQTPLFYAVSHVQAAEIVPLLLRAGQIYTSAMSNVQCLMYNL